MDKIYICNQIKSEILRIVKSLDIKPYNLEGTVFLYDLGYQEKMQFEKLVIRLQTIANEYKTGKQILYGSISRDFTVNQCIRLLIN